MQLVINYSTSTSVLKCKNKVMYTDAFRYVCLKVKTSFSLVKQYRVTADMYVFQGHESLRCVCLFACPKMWHLAPETYYKNLKTDK